MSGAPARALATATDLTALPEEAGAEVVGGQIVYKASPSFEHGDAQSALVGSLRFGGGGGVRGWWLVTEVEVELERHEVYRPDIAGWRRATLPERPRGTPVRVRPDWVCEILSPSTASRDRSTKQQGYHRAGVGHYWIVDPAHETVTVYRHHEDGYLAVTTVGVHDRVALEPFAEVELDVGLLFGRESESTDG